jgi:hypothetical protein
MGVRTLLSPLHVHLSNFFRENMQNPCITRPWQVHVSGRCGSQLSPADKDEYHRKPRFRTTNRYVRLCLNLELYSMLFKSLHEATSFDKCRFDRSSLSLFLDWGCSEAQTRFQSCRIVALLHVPVLCSRVSSALRVCLRRSIMHKTY